jgi:crossover junction endodeoxyribonuclease RuvC
MPSNSQAIYMGIDPGYDRVGWAVGILNQKFEVQPLGYGLIQTSKSATIFERYIQIQTELAEVLVEYHPASAGLETLFFSKNTKTALRVSEARGIIIGELIKMGCSIVEYNPVQIKQAVTGYGQADKKAIEKMVRLQLHITETKIIDDTMDALAILLAHSTQSKLEQKLK